MSTRLTPFRAVLEEVLAAVGQSVDASDQAQKDVAVNRINRRMAEAWDYAIWPETVRSEQRGFAPTWTTLGTYAAGEVVWTATGDTYYEALQEVPAGTALTNAAYWQEASRPTASVIEWEQYGCTEIGRVWRVSTANVFSDDKRRSYSWDESADGIRVRSCTANSVWVLFNIRAPVFSGKTQSGTVNYEAGDIVFSPGTDTAGRFPQQGECYKVVPIAEDPFFQWQVVPFPARFALYVTHAAAADLLRFYGQKDQAGPLMAEARMYLSEEAQKAGNVADININLGI